MTIEITQDIEKGIAFIVFSAIMIIFAVLLDLSAGITAAKKSGEKIKSHNLRRTITKIVDYYRLLAFGVMIDVLGLAFVWYEVPYVAIFTTIGVLLIEAKSVVENYHKAKKSASELPDMILKVIECATDKDAKKIIEAIKDEKNSHT